MAVKIKPRQRDKVDESKKQNGMTNSSRLFGALGIMVIFIAMLLRFHLLGTQSLWNDEGSAYVQATRSLAEIADNAARDIHPPGYYWLLAIWRGLTGESEFALRALSAFASVLSVALTFALGRRLYGGIAGLTAALFVALNTFSIYYAQEARMYALLALWGVAALWAFVGFVRSQTHKREWAVALALLNSGGLYTQYAFPAAMVTQGILFLIWIIAEGVQFFRRQQAGGGILPPRKLIAIIITYVIANVATLVLYLPWLPTALRQITTWPNTGQPIPTEEALTTIIGWFTIGITHTPNSATVAMPFFLLFGLLCFPRLDGARTWWRMLVPVLWVLVTLGGFLALGLFRPANLKFLIPAQIGFALWMGRGIWILWMLPTRRTSPFFRAVPKIAATAGALLLVAGLVNNLAPLYHAPEFQRDDYRAIAALVNADPNPAKAVILNAPGQIEVFGYYYDHDRIDDVFPLPIGMTVDTAATENAVRQIVSDYARIYAVLWGTDERDPQRVVENTLNREAYQIDNVWYGNLRLVRYAAQQTAPIERDSEAVFRAQDGTVIRLAGYSLSSETAAPGDALLVSLNWQTESPMPRGYKVFVQLLKSDGTLAAQRDSEPVGGTRPTNTWSAGEIIEDQHALIIPNDLPESNITLILGLYNPDNAAERLTVTDSTDSDGTSGDYLNLATIHIDTTATGD